MMAGMMAWMALAWVGGMVALAAILLVRLVRIIHRAWLLRQIRKAERFPARNVVLTPGMFRKGGAL